MATQLRVAAPLMHRVSETGGKVAALAAAQCAVYSFPVVFAVVCARTLGPAEYGVVAFYTALTTFLCMFVEFGFDTIGVREVNSGLRRDRGANVLWNVTFAKLMISLPTCAMVLPILLATRSPGEGPMSYAMVVYILAFALEPGWYLRSLELMWSAAVAALVSRGCGIALLVWTVTSPSDLTLAMWTYAFVASASSIVGWLLMQKLSVLKRPRIDVPQLRSLFRSGAAVVMGNLSGASITSGGVVVLGAVADPVLTGAANIAMRIRSAGLAILLPIAQLGHVRLSTLMADRAAALRYGRRLFYLMMGVSVSIALAIHGYVDGIVSFAYGPSQPPVAAFMLTSLVALSLPISAAGSLFAAQCLTLLHQERAYVLILMCAAFVFFGVLFACLEVPFAFGCALLAADVLIAMAGGWMVRRLTLSHASA